MKTTRKCPKCQGGRILRVTQVADQTKAWGYPPPVAEPVHAPATVLWRLARVPGPNPFASSAAGVVEAYVCKGCGFTELYTLSPGAIPVDGVVVQDLVGPDADGPYR